MIGKNSGREITWGHRFEGRFRKAPILGLISVDGRPNRKTYTQPAKFNKRQRARKAKRKKIKWVSKTLNWAVYIALPLLTVISCPQRQYLPCVLSDHETSSRVVCTVLNISLHDKSYFSHCLFVCLLDMPKWLLFAQQHTFKVLNLKWTKLIKKTDTKHLISFL